MVEKEAGGSCGRVLFCWLIVFLEASMAALLLVVALAMVIYAWIVMPLINAGTVLLQAIWLVWLPVLLLVWLLAGKDS